MAHIVTQKTSTAVLLAISLSAPAFADCVFQSGSGFSNPAQPRYEPNSNSTLVCDGPIGQFENLTTPIFSNAEGVSLIINSGATLRGRIPSFNLQSAVLAINLGNNANIHNSGSVRGGIRVGDDSTVINHGDIYGGWPGFQVLVFRHKGIYGGDRNIFENYGAVDFSTFGEAATVSNHSQMSGVSTGSNSVVTNLVGATIESTRASTIALGNGSVFRNFGLVNARTQEFRFRSTDSYAVDLRGGGNIQNEGVIRSRQYAILLTGAGHYTLNNTSAIEVVEEFLGDRAERSVVELSSQGGQTSSSLMLTNTGTIRGISNAISAGLRDGTNSSQSLGELTLINSGWVQGDTNMNSVGDGVVVDENYVADITLLSGELSGNRAFVGGGANDIVRHLGGNTVGRSGVAVDLGGGDDLFVFSGLGTLDGSVLGGSGLDIIRLEGGGGSLNFAASGFERLEVNGGGWLLSNDYGFDDVQLNLGSLSILGTLTGGITVGAGTILNGTGTIDGNVTNNGTIGSYGRTAALSISGDFSNNGNLVIDLGINSMIVGGHAFLNAGSQISVNVSAETAQTLLGERIVFLVAAGGITNEGSAVIRVLDPGFLFDLALEETATELAVRLGLQDLSSIGTDGNLSRFGQALEDSFPLGALDPSLIQSLNGVSGLGEYENAVRALTPSLTFGAARQLHLMNSDALPSPTGRQDHEGRFTWVQINRVERNRGQSTPAFPGYDTTTSLLTMGVDYPVSGDLRAGVTLTSGEFDLDETGNSPDRLGATPYSISAYSIAQMGEYSLMAGVGFTIAGFDGSRISPTGMRISNQFDAAGAFFHLSVNRKFAIGSGQLDVGGLLRSSYFETEDFVENGGLDLAIDRSSQNFQEIGVEIQFQHRIFEEVMAFADVGLFADIGEESFSLRAHIPNGASFHLDRPNDDTQRATFGAGIQSRWGPALFSLSYSGFASEEERSNNIGLQAAIPF
jgi:Autotransporter beta-domain